MTTSLPPCKILLAEDGKANQKMAVGLLEKWGHLVTVAEDGSEAVAKWRSGSFDVVLMDVQMPVMDGLEATRRIRELERPTGKHTPIVAMTARAMKGDRERCLDAGMDDYVSKPVRKTELQRALGKVTAGQRERRPVEVAAGTDGDGACCVVNWSVALETVGGDRHLLREVVAATLQEMPSLLSRLLAAIENDDLETTQRIAHTIKGEAAALAADRTREAAAAIEKSSAERNLVLAREQVSFLRSAIDELVHHCSELAVKE